MNCTKSFFLLLFISLFLPFPLYGMKLRGIEIKGERVIGEKEIRKVLPLQKGRDYSLQEIERGIEKILAEYKERGYLSAKVEVNIDANGVLILFINEGNPALVDKVEFDGQNSFTSEDLLPLLETRPGGRFNQEMVRRDIERIIELYENRGFPFCEVGLSHWEMQGDKIDLGFHIMEGPRVKIEKIRVEGNSKTKGSFIKRISGISPGEYFDQRRLTLARARLEKTGLFLKVGRPLLRILDEPQKGEIILQVEERAHNQAEGLLGYSSSPKGGINGMIYLSLGNIAGTGRRAELRWQRLNQKESKIGFSYWEPFFLNLPLGLGGQLKEREKRGEFNQFTASLSTTVPIGAWIDWQGKVGWERVIWSDSSASMHRYSLGTLVSIETRDFPPNPKKGILYRTSLEYGWRRDYLPDQDFPHKGWNTRIESDLESSLPSFPNQALNLSLHLAQIRGDQSSVPLCDQFGLGGGKSIRGYDEEVAHGSFVAWVNFEYRFLWGRLSRIYPFLDYGYFRFLGGEGRMWGYGFGLSLGSERGVVGLDVGWGRGAALGQAKLHFRLVNNF